MTKREYRTRAFRDFKDELSRLGRTHWYVVYGIRHTAQSFTGTGPWTASQFVTNEFPVPGVQGHNLGISPQKYIDDAEDEIKHFRLLMVVKTCAVLEAYLHRYARYWAIFNGYGGTKPYQLSDVGKAIIAPAMVSNLKNCLEYLQQLLKVSLAPYIPSIAEAYQIRCAAAHNGGIVDAETARKLPKYASAHGKLIALEHGELLQYWKDVLDVANKVDAVLSVEALVEVEGLWRAQELFERDPTLTIPEMRDQMVEDGIDRVPSPYAIRRRFPPGYPPRKR